MRGVHLNKYTEKAGVAARSISEARDNIIVSVIIEKSKCITSKFKSGKLLFKEKFAKYSGYMISSISNDHWTLSTVHSDDLLASGNLDRVELFISCFCSVYTRFFFTLPLLDNLPTQDTLSDTQIMICFKFCAL